MPRLAGRGWTVVLLAGVVTAVTGSVHLDEGVHSAAFAAAVAGVVAAVLAMVVAAAGWRVALAHARRSTPSTA